MIEYDLHVHTGFSTDSTEIPENMVKKVQELQMKGLCFTDHMDYFYPEKCIEEAGGDFLFDANAYYKKMLEVKECYSNRTEVLIGVEIGLRNEPGISEKCWELYHKLTQDFPFDFVIGSTHCLENNDPYMEDYWYERKAEEGLEVYYRAIAENISGCTCFDTLGHLDYLVRYVSKEAALRSYSERQKSENICFTDEILNDKRFYGKYLYRPSDFSDITDEILKKLIASGKALEVNTAGLKYGLGFAHPKKELLVRYRELGGELITIGSDAHEAGHLAGHFEAVREELKTIGFKHYYIYKNRKAEGLLL